MKVYKFLLKGHFDDAYVSADSFSEAEKKIADKYKFSTITSITLLGELITDK